MHQHEKRVVVVKDLTEVSGIQIIADDIAGVVRQEMHHEDEYSHRDENIENSKHDSEYKTAAAVEKSDRSVVIFLGNEMSDQEKHKLDGQYERKE